MINKIKWEDYEKLAYQFIHKKLRTTKLYDFDDYKQEAFLVFLNCKKNYKKDFNIKFSTYFYNGLKNKFLNTLNRKIIPEKIHIKNGFNENTIKSQKQKNKEEIKYDHNYKIISKIIT